MCALTYTQVRYHVLKKRPSCPLLHTFCCLMVNFLLLAFFTIFSLKHFAFAGNWEIEKNTNNSK